MKLVLIVTNTITDVAQTLVHPWMGPIPYNKCMFDNEIYIKFNFYKSFLINHYYKK